MSTSSVYHSSDPSIVRAIDIMNPDRRLMSMECMMRSLSAGEIISVTPSCFHSHPAFDPKRARMAQMPLSIQSADFMFSDHTRFATEFFLVSFATNDYLQTSNKKEFFDSKPESKPSTTNLTNTNLLLVDSNDIKPWDILHDGGDKSTNHPGNIRFRNYVKEKGRLTTTANERSMKEVSTLLYNYVTGYGGRFIQQIPGFTSQQWKIMTPEEATTATYQVLQEIMGTAARQISIAAVMNENSKEATTNEATACPMQVDPSPPGTEIHNDNVRPSDILAGRGARSNLHPGNKEYRRVIDELLEKKHKAQTTHGYIARALILYMKKEWKARFLKRKSNTNNKSINKKISNTKKTSNIMWVVMNDAESCKKVIEVLRKGKKRHSDDK